MATFDTELETTGGAMIPAMSGPDGKKFPGSVVAHNGQPVSTTNRFPTTALATIDAAQLSSLVGAVEASTAALEALDPSDIDPTNALVDGDLLDTLTAAPYSADIENLADLADATNTHIGAQGDRITDLEDTVTAGTTGLVDKVAALEDAVTDLQALVATQAADIAALEAYNVSNP